MGYSDADLEVASLRAEVDRLQAIVDRLPKTADGVSALMGDAVFVIFDGQVQQRRVMQSGGDDPGVLLVDMDCGLGWEVSQSYSTREAAEAARSKT